MRLRMSSPGSHILRRMRAFPTLFALAFSLATAGADELWTQFRGPNQGHSDAKGVPLHWSETEGVKWKTPLPGAGWSSPVVANGKIWMTTATEEGKSLRALCCDLETGKLLIDVEVIHNEVAPPKHERNSYASPTPILDGDRIYADFGEMGSACLATDNGHKIWENHDLRVDHQNGPGGSAVLYKDKLLVACDGMDQQYGAALDKMTGKRVWRADRSAIPKLATRPADMRKAYATPVVFTIAGQPQALSCGAERLYSNNPDTGKELWYVDYPGFSNVPIPVYDGKQIYVCTGFMKPELWAIKAADLQGDVTDTHIAWKYKVAIPDQTTPLVEGERLYMVSSNGIASCLNTADGTLLWKQRVGTDFAASPLFVDGRIYLWSAGSGTTVIAPGDSYQELARNELADGCMATPAVVGKAFIVRTKTALYRIEN